MLYLKESTKKNHILSNRLPVELDNRLYSMIHLIGGMDFEEVINFAHNSTPDQISQLFEKVMSFPATMSEIIPYLEGIHMLKDTDEYQEILNIIKFTDTNNQVKQLHENVEIDADGFYDKTDNPYFNRYFEPRLKSKLFDYWTNHGKATYNSLKLFGVSSDELYPDLPFSDVPDIVFPLLKLEWLGGWKHTDFYKKSQWENIETLPFNAEEVTYSDFKFEPNGFDFTYDESGSFGDTGYSCWDIKLQISKNTRVIKVGEKWPTGIDENYEFISEVFPQKYLNKFMSQNNYTTRQVGVVTSLWENSRVVQEFACEYFCTYCNLEVVLV